MSVPKFADLNKAASDLFKDDFAAGEVKLTLKSTASNGVNLKVEGTKCTETNKVNAEIETKFTTANGVTVKEVWNSKNALTLDASTKDLLLKGSGASLAVTFSPSEGYQSFKLKTDIVRNKCNTDFVYDGKNLTGSVVASFSPFLLGVSAVANPSKGIAPTNYTLGAGYRSGDIIVNSLIKNGSDIEGSVFHTPRAGVKAGVQFNYASGSSETAFAVVGQYAYDKDTTLKAKVDTKLNLNLSYKQALRPSVFLTLGAQVDAARLNSDKNKLGLTLELIN